MFCRFSFLIVHFIIFILSYPSLYVFCPLCPINIRSHNYTVHVHLTTFWQCCDHPLPHHHVCVYLCQILIMMVTCKKMRERERYAYTHMQLQV